MKAIRDLKAENDELKRSNDVLAKRLERIEQAERVSSKNSGNEHEPSEANVDAGE